jgi:hypothetical protein
LLIELRNDILVLTDFFVEFRSVKFEKIVHYQENQQKKM